MAPPLVLHWLTGSFSPTTIFLMALFTWQFVAFSLSVFLAIFLNVQMSFWQSHQAYVITTFFWPNTFFSHHILNDFSKCNASESLNHLNMYSAPCSFFSHGWVGLWYFGLASELLNHLNMCTSSRYFSSQGWDGFWYCGLARERAVNLAPLPLEHNVVMLW